MGRKRGRCNAAEDSGTGGKKIVTVEENDTEGKSPDNDVYVENNMDVAEVVGGTPGNTDLLSLITATDDITATNNAKD